MDKETIKEVPTESFEKYKEFVEENFETEEEIQEALKNWGDIRKL